ncbi:MAG: molecular chaperone HtpG [Eubacterium sp.]|nr:molecular chaperone HtpG [Eubacterium sp.]
MTQEQGNLAINSENIFPIIKKWLYSDHDIFLREVVSNGCDAITKLKKLSLIGEANLPEDYKAKIEVEVNPEEKTLTIRDNGLGMTADEVKEYINQIAFSGATDFLEKYKDKTNEEQIIGHFGLGFYSIFMVSDSAEINTLSYKEGAEAVHWESDGGLTFEMDGADKDSVGTEIILHLNEDSYEFANEYRVREVLEKYCSFMPVEIFLSKANAEPEYETIPMEELLETDTLIEEIVEEPKEEDKEEDKEGEEKEEPLKKAKILKRPVSVSDISPLWNKHPNECTDEEYKAFYRKVFNDYREPLFWIHLNMDYPFNLKGILYFPRVNLEYENVEGMIKLYNNQVFIADNIKEVIPEFLMLLKGVIDCPDLPLNVSRSALQNDGFVKKISDYITKKVADKLSGLCKTDRENYENYWDDISPFIKFGCLRDEKFKDKIKDYVLFKDLDDKYSTLTEYLDTLPEPVEVVEEGKEEEDSENKEKPRKVIYYTTDLQQQSQYINMFRDQELNAVVLTEKIDQPFVTALEAGDEGVRFQRIDAELTDDFKDEASEEELKEETETLKELFKKATGKENLEVKVEKLKDEKVSSVITMSEESRRMQDMMKMYAMNGMGGMDMGDMGQTLVLNSNNALVQYLLANKEGDKTDLFCKQLYDLALISNQPLAADKMTEFIQRSNEIMMLLTK